MASKKKSGVEARVFAGVGESKIHAAPVGTFQEALDWDKLTFNGEPIPENFRNIFTYAMTDQGKAEEEAAIEARGGRAVVEFARDAQDKKIDEYGDKLAHNTSGLIKVSDPLQVLMDRYLPKGKRGRWLGRRKMAEAGMIRGVVEYTPVMIDDDDGGQKQVQLGGMILAMIPEETAKEAEAHYAEIEAENRIAVNDRVMEHNEKNVGSDRLTRAANRRGKLDDLVGEVDDSERAAADLEHDLATSAIS